MSSKLVAIHVPWAKADVFDYIEVFYSRVRLHNPLGGVSPKASEMAHLRLGHAMCTWGA
ncbi:hypothetical protein ACFQGA_10860 [Marinobacter koreensis]|uniref:Integrase catalytic domain-containing protein n=1 Tax=Marinobacter koreensis TaxID=335974 RepID=A0ABW0RJE3_9GAMM|nr:hypothetical protein [Marinobacter koreensis]MCK7548607.1 hypothetical protein [Marinobacter koreensis]